MVQKNPPSGCNLGPKFPPHVGRSPKRIRQQFRPYIKKSMVYNIACEIVQISEEDHGPSSDQSFREQGQERKGTLFKGDIILGNTAPEYQIFF